MGLTQGVIAALVAETAPGDLRGTAFGVFNLVTGMITLVASVLAGLLWDSIGPAATFLGGAVWAIVAVVMIPSARGKGLNVDHSVTM
jgi:MFS family permease